VELAQTRPEHRRRSLKAHHRGIGRMDTTELAEGYIAKLIFEKHADKLAGKISYPQFVRYVRPLREASPLPTKPTQAIPHEPPDVIAPAIPATGAPPRARPEPTARPTFVHDGRTKEGEPEKLFGPGLLPGSRK
jgi:hypothetical protein